MGRKPKEGNVIEHMPKGTDEVNYGGQSYPVDHDGEVEVPAKLGEILEKQGGAEPEVEIVDTGPEGFVGITHPDSPSTFISHEGVTYEFNKDRVCYVPSHVASVLVESHGFQLV